MAAPKGQTTFSAPTINHRHGLKEGLETLTSSAFANNHRRSLREGLKTLTSSAPTNNYCRGLREGLEIRTSSALTNNQSRGLRKGLETQLVSTTSTLFVSGSDIPENTPSSIEPAETGYTLWRGYRWRSGIKDSTSTARSLCKYTWEVNLVYSFDRRWTFRPRYMTRNTRSSRGHKGNDENNMGEGGTLSAKGK